MRLVRRQFLQVAAGAVALPAISRIARAQIYPTRTVTMIVPNPAGGGTDAPARIVGEHMSHTLGPTKLIPVPKSEMGQTQKSECATGKSALPSTTVIVGLTCQVRKVPEPDVAM